MDKKMKQKEAIDILYKLDVGIVQNNLIYCIEKKDANKVELLLIAGLSPNEPWYHEQQKRRFYPLHHAAVFSNPEIIQLLVKHKVDIDLHDDKGFSPIFRAIEKNKIENVKTLIECGANLNHMSKNKMKPLYFARKKKKSEIIEILLKSGAEEMSNQELKGHQRTKLPKRILIVSVIIGLIWIIGSAIISPSSSSNNNSSASPSSSENRYCSKHGVMYNPNNAWKGCPKCVEEEDQKKMKKALEKSRRL